MAGRTGPTLRHNFLFSRAIADAKSNKAESDEYSTLMAAASEDTEGSKERGKFEESDSRIPPGTTASGTSQPAKSPSQMSKSPGQHRTEREEMKLDKNDKRSSRHRKSVEVSEKHRSSGGERPFSYDEEKRRNKKEKSRHSDYGHSIRRNDYDAQSLKLPKSKGTESSYESPSELPADNKNTKKLFESASSATGSGSEPTSRPTKKPYETSVGESGRYKGRGRGYLSRQRSSGQIHSRNNEDWSHQAFNQKSNFSNTEWSSASKEGERSLTVQTAKALNVDDEVKTTCDDTKRQRVEPPHQSGRKGRKSFYNDGRTEVREQIHEEKTLQSPPSLDFRGVGDKEQMLQSPSSDSTSDQVAKEKMLQSPCSKTNRDEAAKEKMSQSPPSAYVSGQVINDKIFQSPSSQTSRDEIHEGQMYQASPSAANVETVNESLMPDRWSDMSSERPSEILRIQRPLEHNFGWNERKGHAKGPGKLQRNYSEILYEQQWASSSEAVKDTSLQVTPASSSEKWQRSLSTPGNRRQKKSRFSDIEPHEKLYMQQAQMASSGNIATGPGVPSVPGDLSKDSTPSNIVAPQTTVDNLELQQQACRRFTEKFCCFHQPLADSHCHLDLLLWDRHRWQSSFTNFQAKMAQTFPPNYVGCIAVFAHPKHYEKASGFQKVVTIFEEEKNVFSAVGCHPKCAAIGLWNEQLEATLRKFIDIGQRQRVVAVGECGLDYSQPQFAQAADKQRESFIAQMKLATELDLPLVVHCRDADDDCFKVMQENLRKDHPIHRHCYTGTAENMEKWHQAFPNMYFGFTPLVINGNAWLETIKRVPIDRLLLETDAPYFLPGVAKNLPGMNGISHPGMSIAVAKHMGWARAVTVDRLLADTYNNTCRLYKVDFDQKFGKTDDSSASDVAFSGLGTEQW